MPEDAVIPFSLNKKNLLLLDGFGVQGDFIVVTLHKTASTGVEAYKHVYMKHEYTQEIILLYLNFLSC